jgi:hypothetical protein
MRRAKAWLDLHGSDLHSYGAMNAGAARAAANDADD